MRAGPRPALVRWAVSRVRWLNAVLVEGAFGAGFALAPWATMAFMEVRPSPETATLFRLYGILLAARAVGHHALFRVPDPRALRTSMVADLGFAAASAGVLAAAVVNGLAGPRTWLVVGLFGVESVAYVAGLAGLAGVEREALEVAAEEARRRERREAPGSGRDGPPPGAPAQA